ncbi:protein translocase subunit SecF, partial [Candidatus Woesebacteria bacterium]|nr:protein translocase subunit SecF [Candidatus Woesebacteria bacterium]
MIRFSKFTWLYLIISCIVIGSGLYSIVRWGYTISIDFTGGTEVSYKVDQSAKASLTKAVVEKAIKEAKGEYQSYDLRNDGTLIIRANNIDEKAEVVLREALATSASSPLTLLRLNTVGPVIGKEALQKTLIAVALGILAILGYIFYAFRRMSFALAAVVALVHDVLVVLGTYSLLGHFMGAQFDTLFITGLLTTMTFSTHDTIVIFDKIREYRKTRMNAPIEELADKAVSATMVRSVNNSLTILFMLVALVFLGGASIRFFAITLLIGTLTGVYSSPFVATPVMMWLEKRSK